MKRFTLIASGYLLIYKEDTILLSRRYNTGFEDGKYSVPAGHLEAHETIRQCAIREGKEEIGIILKPEQLSLVHVMHRTHDDERIDYFFQATRWEGTITNKEPEKCDDLSWFPINSLPTNTIPYIQKAIELSKKGIIYSEFGWNLKNYNPQ